MQAEAAKTDEERETWLTIERSWLALAVLSGDEIDQMVSRQGTKQDISSAPR